MKTDIEIKDIIYAMLKESDIPSLISGEVYKDSRPHEGVQTPTQEDLVISISDGGGGSEQLQVMYANVNVYVPDIARGDEYIEDIPRLRVISSALRDVLEHGVRDGFIFDTTRQKVYAVEGIDAHVVSHRLKITFVEE